jgi:hypothetical protein
MVQRALVQKAQDRKAARRKVLVQKALVHKVAAHKALVHKVVEARARFHQAKVVLQAPILLVTVSVVMAKSMVHLGREAVTRSVDQYKKPVVHHLLHQALALVVLLVRMEILMDPYPIVVDFATALNGYVIYTRPHLAVHQALLAVVVVRQAQHPLQVLAALRQALILVRVRCNHTQTLVRRACVHVHITGQVVVVCQLVVRVLFSLV